MALGIALALLAPGCRGAEREQAAPRKLDQAAAQAALRTYAEIARAAYADALSEARLLEQSVARFVQQPSAEGLALSQKAWLAARVPYVQTEVFRFYDGPIDSVELWINTWPIDESYVDSNLPDLPGLIQDRTRLLELTTEALARANVSQSETSVSTGYHVIEFLLWGRDTRAEGPGQRDYADFVSADPTSEQARRARYLLLACQLLVAQLEQVLLAWSPEGTNNFRAHWLSMPVERALGLAIKGMGSLSGPELAGERLSVAYETKDQENEHSCFSDSTHLDMVGDALGVENLCLGRYRSPGGALVSGAGLCALVGLVDAKLAARLRVEISASVQAARLIPAPFDQALLGADSAPGRKAIARTIRALEAQALSLTRAASSLGADLGLASARSERP